METNEEQLARLEAKLDAVNVSVEKTRKYVFGLVVTMVVAALLPILLGALMLPFLTSTLGSVYGGI